MRPASLLHLVVLVVAVSAAASADAQSYKFVRQWGTHGSGPGQLSSPTGLALDRHGHIYVTEFDNNRVQRFRLDGTFVSKWGGSGTGAGQFNRPEGITVDTSGNVYVTDWGGHRVQKFAADGQFITQWGSYGQDPGYFQHPRGIAVDTIGNVYVADHPDPVLLRTESDPLNDRVQKFTDGGGFITQWGGTGSAAGQLNFPTGVGVDRAGHVYVCDYLNSRIQKFSNTGAYIAEWGSSGTDPGQFQGPIAVAVDRGGNVFVADYQNNRIQKFSNTGTFITQWGSTGSDAGEFSGPDAIAVDDSGNVYVAETDNDRIQVFSPTPHVLLVHGFCGGPGDWTTFASLLADSGYVVHTIAYGPGPYSDPPDTYLGHFASALDSIGVDHIAVIAHSMGGLIARKYSQQQRTNTRPDRIGQLVTLGTPHYGNDLGPFLMKGRDLADLACRLKIAGVPCDSVSRKFKNSFGCQGDPLTTKALLDMAPGSSFLNRLNYATSTNLYDTPKKKGWDAHASETTLIPGTYYASIAGTGTECKNAGFPVWGIGHENDGVVAIQSAKLTNTAAFRARDVDLLMGHLSHSTGPFLCLTPYTASDTLARKVSRILTTTPSSPPVSLQHGPVLVEGIYATTDAADDSLQDLPAVVDTIRHGQIAVHAVTIPSTTLLQAMLLSDDARLTLKRPNGTVISLADTSTANGIAFVGEVGSGFEGYRIANPAAGTWTLQVDATNSAGRQQYGALVSVASAVVTTVTVRSPIIYAPDSIRVRAQVQEGALRSDVTWSCVVIGPDDVSTDLTLFDDGAHGDSLNGDGIYGNKKAPGSGVGVYRVGAQAALPGGAAFVADATCELAYFDDLIVGVSDINLSRNVVQAGDSVSVLATVHNGGSRAAMGVGVEILDQRFGILLGKSTVDIASGGGVTVQAPWKVALPDTHTIEVRVNPYVFESEANYENNVGFRTVILGSPVSVDGPSSFNGHLWLAPPQPNPSNGLVSFGFEIPVRGNAALEVFDVLGRRICRWSWVDMSAGRHTVDWNGRRQDGSPTAPGVLLCRLTAAGQTASRKIVFRP